MRWRKLIILMILNTPVGMDFAGSILIVFVYMGNGDGMNEHMCMYGFNEHLEGLQS